LDTASLKANNEERELLSAFLQNTLPGSVKARKLKPNRVKLWDGGLEEIDKALAYLQNGNASAEKVVIRLEAYKDLGRA
jgi:hypothetical protein